MFYLPESEQNGLKGLKILGTFIQKVGGDIRFFIGLSDGSIFVAVFPEKVESLFEPEDVIKETEFRICDSDGEERMLVHPDTLDHQLRKIRSRIFNSASAYLRPMETPKTREFYFETFGEDFKKWYLSLEIPEKPSQDATVIRGGRGRAMDVWRG